MTLQELDTAARHKLAVVNVVNNDGGWGMCKSGQLMLYGPQALRRDRPGLRAGRLRRYRPGFRRLRRTGGEGGGHQAGAGTGHRLQADRPSWMSRCSPCSTDVRRNGGRGAAGLPDARSSRAATGHVDRREPTRSAPRLRPPRGRCSILGRSVRSAHHPLIRIEEEKASIPSRWSFASRLSWTSFGMQERSADEDMGDLPHRRCATLD